jgi:hypothetical protein
MARLVALVVLAHLRQLTPVRLVLNGPVALGLVVVVVATQVELVVLVVITGLVVVLV